MALHEALGKVLGAFELCAGLRGSYDRDVTEARVGLEVIINAFHERVFGTNDNHVYGVVEYKLTYGIEVVGT